MIILKCQQSFGSAMKWLLLFIDQNYVQLSKSKTWQSFFNNFVLKIAYLQSCCVYVYVWADLLLLIIVDET